MCMILNALTNVGENIPGSLNYVGCFRMCFLSVAFYNEPKRKKNYVRVRVWYLHVRYVYVARACFGRAMFRATFT